MKSCIKSKRRAATPKRVVLDLVPKVQTISPREGRLEDLFFGEPEPAGIPESKRIKTAGTEAEAHRLCAPEEESARRTRIPMAEVTNLRHGSPGHGHKLLQPSQLTDVRGPAPQARSTALKSAVQQRTKVEIEQMGVDELKAKIREVAQRRRARQRGRAPPDRQLLLS